MNKYWTNNKKKIMKYIKNINGEFSAQTLYETMVSNNEKVGLTTIYRFLDELNENGDINKTYDNNTSKYQYLEKCDNVNHFYLKCDNCGNIIHIDCECINKLQEHILLEHNFKSNNRNIIIDGLCSKCIGEVKND